MTNEELVIRIKAGIEPKKNMDQLYHQVSRFIHAMALNYQDTGEREDVEQEGFLALYAAVEGYDPKKGASFLTYASYHIRQRMKRYMQTKGSCLSLSVGIQEKLKTYQRFIRMFTAETGVFPSAALISYVLGFSLNEVEEIQRLDQVTQIKSLDETIRGIDGTEESTLMDFVPDKHCLEDEVLDNFQSKQLKETLWNMVDTLPSQQARVIQKRFKENMTLEATGKGLGLPREAVRREQEKALRELRKPERSCKLLPFLPEDETLYRIAITGNSYKRFNTTWTSSTERAALYDYDKG